jgi:hypothetical protein
MLPRITITLIVLGFVVAILGALSRGYVRSRLRESGVALKSWVTIGDELRYAEKYLKLANSHHLPRLPAILAIIGIPGAFVLMVLGLMLRR